MTQRKGLADLFAAARLLARKDIEFVVMGTPVAAMGFYRRQYPDFVYEPPRPHAAVLALMRTCDLLCLPSIVEGRALVVQEAMSQGLPVIVTPNTGADDVVEDGQNGFVVPIRSPEAIVDRVGWLADHRDRLPSMGEVARAAAGRLTWEDYGRTVSEALRACPPKART
jgi:glycosyltransferase involved in cell wall biosynthesis